MEVRTNNTFCQNTHKVITIVPLEGSYRHVEGNLLFCEKLLSKHLSANNESRYAIFNKRYETLETHGKEMGSNHQLGIAQLLDSMP